MNHLRKDFSHLKRSLQGLLVIAKKLVTDTESNLARLEKIDTEVDTIESLREETRRLKKRLETQIQVVLPSTIVRMPPNLFGSLPPGNIEELAVELILPVEDRLDKHQKKVRTRLMRCFHLDIITIKNLQAVGGLEYFESSYNVGAGSLRMLAASMAHHNITWKR